MTKNQANRNGQFYAGAMTLLSSADIKSHAAGNTMNNGEKRKELTHAGKEKAGKGNCRPIVREILSDAGKITWQANPIVITSAHGTTSFQKENVEAAQRLALPASGRAWSLLGSREKLKAEEMPLKRADSHLSGARRVSPHNDMLIMDLRKL